MTISEAVGKFAYCPYHVNFFKTRNQWYNRGAVTPKAGDIIFFQTTSSPGVASHVGIVEKCSGNTVYTIEGNTSNTSALVTNGGGVWRKSYSLTSSYVLGYGRPAYPSGGAEKVVNVANSQIGYLEKRTNADLESFTGNAGSNNYTKYGAWYGMNGEPWCDMFVSWCGYIAGKAVSYTEGWQKTDKGWWYQLSDGSWPANAWKKIDGKWYYFNADGYMVTNEWKVYNGNSYYLGGDGAMVTNHTVILDSTGALVPNGKYYHTFGELSDGYKAGLKSLVDCGALKGKGGTGDDMILDMTEDAVRCLIVMWRATHD